jgi:hypothetical protein
MVPGHALVAQGRPTPQELFDRHARAVGGREAWARVRTREDVGTAVLNGNAARVTIRWAAPRRWALVYDFADSSQTWNGYDGAVAWYEDGFANTNRVQGVDSLNYALTADLVGTLHPAGTLQSAEVVGEETFDGQPAWRVRVVHPGGTERTYFFARASGLRIGELAPNTGGVRTITIKSWMTVDGLTVPSWWTVASPSTSREFRITQVRFGVPVDATIFRAPAFGADVEP